MSNYNKLWLFIEPHQPPPPVYARSFLEGKKAQGPCTRKREAEVAPQRATARQAPLKAKREQETQLLAEAEAKAEIEYEVIAQPSQASHHSPAALCATPLPPQAHSTAAP